MTKKLNLTPDEKIKIYTLIKNSQSFNSEIKSNDELISIAYDLRFDDLFDLYSIYKKYSKGNTKFTNENIKKYCEKIKELINELKKSQPILPVTKFPKASRINKAITTLNPDGSTNIKGIYKDKDGLIVIKFNELETASLSEIGFKKGSITKEENIQKNGKPAKTGNIKFFAHGLDFENQLAKFDTFSLIDSEALLSVSYAESPETKYRFFRPQGIILDCDTKFIHGGGETDSGSGYKKDIETFKKNYLFGAKRVKDRVFVSNLIKKTLNLNDEEYIDFADKNKNKEFCEIEPLEAQNKLINAFSKINSRTRFAKRQYNEMYITNPKEIMAVYAYEMDYKAKVGNPIEFLNRTQPIQKKPPYPPNITMPEVRCKFLRRYALLHDIPFVVFGD